MDKTEKSTSDDRAFVVELARKVSSIRGGTVLLRPAAKSEPNFDWVLEIDGIGRIYFKPDAKTNCGFSEVQRFEFKKRSPRKRTDNGKGAAGVSSGIQPAQS